MRTKWSAAVRSIALVALMSAIGMLPTTSIGAATTRPVLSISDVRVLESDFAANLPVTLSQPVTGSVTVRYATVSETAKAGRDFVAQSGTLTFAPGSTEQWIGVRIANDNDRERPILRFRVRLDASAGAGIGDGSALVRILDDDWTGRATLDPATGLLDGQLVRVQARGLPTGLKVYLRECEPASTPNSPYFGPCDQELGSTVVAPGGRLDTTVRVVRSFPFYDGKIYDCAFERCGLQLLVENAEDGDRIGFGTALHFEIPV